MHIPMKIITFSLTTIVERQLEKYVHFTLGIITNRIIIPRLQDTVKRDSVLLSFPISFILFSFLTILRANYVFI